MMTPSGGSINEQDLKAAIAQVAASFGEDYSSPASKTRKSIFRRRPTKKVTSFVPLSTQKIFFSLLKYNSKRCAIVYCCCCCSKKYFTLKIFGYKVKIFYL